MRSDKLPLIVYKKIPVYNVTCIKCGNSTETTNDQTNRVTPKGFAQMFTRSYGSYLVCKTCYPNHLPMNKWATEHNEDDPKAPKRGTAPVTRSAKTKMVAVEITLYYDDAINKLVAAALSNTSNKASTAIGRAVVRKNMKVADCVVPTKIKHTIEIVEDNNDART